MTDKGFRDRNCAEVEDQELLDKAYNTLDKIKTLVGSSGVEPKQVPVTQNKRPHTNLEYLGSYRGRNEKEQNQEFDRKKKASFKAKYEIISY